MDHDEVTLAKDMGVSSGGHNKSIRRFRCRFKKNVLIRTILQVALALNVVKILIDVFKVIIPWHMSNVKAGWGWVIATVELMFCAYVGYSAIYHYLNCINKSSVVTDTDLREAEILRGEWITDEGEQYNQVCVRYCDKCKNPSPLKSYHCGICKKCIMMMDHHCIWTGCCIGKNNRINFFMFILYSFLFLSYYIISLATIDGIFSKENIYEELLSGNDTNDALLFFRTSPISLLTLIIVDSLILFMLFMFITMQLWNIIHGKHTADLIILRYTANFVNKPNYNQVHVIPDIKNITIKDNFKEFFDIREASDVIGLFIPWQK